MPFIGTIWRLLIGPFGPWLIVAVMGLGGYAFIQVEQVRIGQLKAEVVALEVDKTALGGQIADLSRSYERLEKALIDTQADQQAFNMELAALAKAQSDHAVALNKLNSKLAKHDLGRLSEHKPSLVEGAINKGTNDYFERLREAGRW